MNANAALYKETGRLVNTPHWIDSAVRRFRAEGERGIAWEWDHLPAYCRGQLDYWLLELDHPLTHQPGTVESRFNQIVVERSKQMPV